MRAWLLDLLYPPKCVFCGRLLEAREEELICPACRGTLPFMGQSCKKRAEFVEEIAAALYYKGYVRESVHRFKFAGARFYAATYGRLAAQAVRAQLSGGYDVICWVPLSPARRRRRGYDQAEAFARALGAALECPVEALLEKTRDTPPQSRTGADAARRANVSGCYRVPNPSAAANRRILLADDVITSGATVGEGARMLRMAGAREIRCVALAVAPGDEKAKKNSELIF